MCWFTAADFPVTASVLERIFWEIKIVTLLVYFLRFLPKFFRIFTVELLEMFDVQCDAYLMQLKYHIKESYLK